MQAVADVFGISRASVASWESGNSNPDHKKLQELSNLFGCTVQFLLTGETAFDNKQKSNGVRFINFDLLGHSPNEENSSPKVVPIYSSPGPKAFATRYLGSPSRNWAPTSIPSGSLLIVDPSVELGPTSFVLLEFKKTTGIFLAQVRQTPTNKNYFLLDDDLKTQVNLDSKVKVLGVVLEWQLSAKLY